MFEFMTMEKTFIVSWLGGITLGIVLGSLTYWIFEKDNKKGD